jgi:aminomethyltransferase
MTMATCFSDPVQEYWDVRIVESNVSPMQIQGSKAPLVVAALFGDWAAYSPRLEKNLGFANVPVGRSKRGDRLTVKIPVGMVRGTVVPRPFTTSSKTVTLERGPAAQRAARRRGSFGRRPTRS